MIERANRTVREETDSHLMLNYQDAVNTIKEIASWYNTKRRHSSLHYLTPKDYYRGDPDNLLRTRQFKIDNARKIRKERNIMKRKGGEVAESTSNSFCILSQIEINSTVPLSSLSRDPGMR